jgi:D-3-phosphoglycerate dehydrogenase / 2-oxoglutarate reductase
MRVLLTDRAWPDSNLERSRLAGTGIEWREAPDNSEATLEEWAADVDVIATCWAKVTRRVMDAAPRLRGVCRLGIGLDNIDVPHATSRRIPVTNVPDYCVEEVADHTLALILALARNVGFFHYRTKQGEYALAAGPVMHRLRGRTLGLIGLGRIGAAVARRAAAFGLSVQATTSSGGDHGTGVPIVSLEHLCRTSDVLSIHAPLTAATRHLVGARELTWCRPESYLVNTSRGGLVDPQALWDALRKGRLAGAALDVFEPEPPDLGHPLYRDERVIVTPHAAFVSAESVLELRNRVVDQVLALKNGNRPENVVNPEVL